MPTDNLLRGPESFWDGKSRRTSEDIPVVLWNPNIITVFTIQARVLRQMNAVHMLISCLLRIVFPSTPKYPFRFSD